MDPRIFLRAQWRWLAVFNFEVDPRILLPLIPHGVELDEFHGRSLISLVGFEFAGARLMGMPIPFHQLFPELNLRCYVRRRVDDEVRRGVFFLKEIVPRRAVVWVASHLFNESFQFASMTHTRGIDGVTYEVHIGAQRNRLRVMPAGEPFIPPTDSEASFVLDRAHAYNVSRPGRTMEYHVEHPQWRIWRATTFDLEVDTEKIYGQVLGAVLRGRPTSVFLADGSLVQVHRGATVDMANNLAECPRRTHLRTARTSA